MKKKYRLLVISILLTGLFSGCASKKFDGSKISNDNMFKMNYSILNEDKSHIMNLQKDDIIDVIVENISGRIDIFISDTEGNKIYRGNDADSVNFKLTIPETKNYKFTVIGKKAKGSVSFKIANRQ